MISINLVKKKKITKLIVIYLLLFTFSQANTHNSGIQASIIADYTDISVSDAYDMIENNSSLFIFDVRTEEEYSAGHIKDSYLLPYTEIESRQDEIPENESQPILVYCRSGRRSAIASATLVDLNFTLVYNMLDGFLAWMDANYPYEKSIVYPTHDLTDVILVITIIGTLGFVIILFAGILVSKKNQKNKDLINKY